VLAALRRLPRRQREVLVLRFYLKLSDAEIARTLGIGESTVRSTAHRGPAVLECILIGEMGGHAFVVRNGHRQPIPWSANISTALGLSAPGAAW
jgi:hypothetical protein